MRRSECLDCRSRCSAWGWNGGQGELVCVCVYLSTQGVQRRASWGGAIFSALDITRNARLCTDGSCLICIQWLKAKTLGFRLLTGNPSFHCLEIAPAPAATSSLLTLKPLSKSVDLTSSIEHSLRWKIPAANAASTVPVLPPSGLVKTSTKC